MRLIRQLQIVGKRKLRRLSIAKDSFLLDAKIRSVRLQIQVRMAVAKLYPRWLRRLRRSTGQLLSLAKGVAISIVGVAIALAMIMFSPIKAHIAAFDSLEAILTQMGATYGTILALALSLSITPIQRASEVWSPSVIRLYKNDLATQITVVVLGVLCVASFSFGVKSLSGMPVHAVLAFFIATLGMSLDLLRWYHSHICQLLDPKHAIQLTLHEALSAIRKFSADVAYLAKQQHADLVAQGHNEFTVEDVEGAVYKRIPQITRSLRARVDDVAEIAAKALTRREGMAFGTAADALQKIAVGYLHARKDNLIVGSGAGEYFLATTSDTSELTDHVYQSLYRLACAAIKEDDDASAMRACEALQIAAVHALNLNAPSIQAGSAPLAVSAVYYLKETIKYAQNKGVDEVAFQSAALLKQIALASPLDTRETDVLVPIVDGLFEIAAYFYSKKNFGLAEEVWGNAYETTMWLLGRKDHTYDRIFRMVLERTRALVPLAIMNERLSGRISVVHPMQKAYGLISTYSIGYQVSLAFEKYPHLDEARSHLNPYRECMDLLENIAEHFRQVALDTELSNSFLLWEMNSTVKHIAEVVAKCVEEPLRPDHLDEHKLIDKLLSVIAFYWRAFHNKVSIDQRRAEECCSSLAYIGLLFFERGHSQLIGRSVSAIQSITNSYCATANPPDFYAVGDQYATLWGIRRALAADGSGTLIALVDTALTSKPAALQPDQWMVAREMIERRKSQLDERLDEIGRGYASDDLETIVRSAISRGSRSS